MANEVDARTAFITAIQLTRSTPLQYSSRIITWDGWPQAIDIALERHQDARHVRHYRKHGIPEGTRHSLLLLYRSRLPRTGLSRLSAIGKSFAELYMIFTLQPVQG
nr:unnamed protein product [Spirometra erinaceieuropaei]